VNWSIPVDRLHPEKHHTWVALAVPPDVRPTERVAAVAWLLLAAGCLGSDGALADSPVLGALGYLLPQRWWGVVFLLVGLADLYAILASQNAWLPFAKLCRGRFCRLQAMNMNVYLSSLLIVAALVRAVVWPLWAGQPAALPLGVLPITAMAVGFYYSCRELAGRV
jgi:hypothetical protein